jgi:DNA-binding Xre family transcriptional regulator
VNDTADLVIRLEQAEAERDALALRLAMITDAGIERVPAALARRLMAGEAPVRVWREHRGLALHALAKQAGISSSLLSEIETGKKDGSVRTLAALARALAVDLDDLVSWS